MAVPLPLCCCQLSDFIVACGLGLVNVISEKTKVKPIYILIINALRPIKLNKKCFFARRRKVGRLHFACGRLQARVIAVGATGQTRSNPKPFRK